MKDWIDYFKQTNDGKPIVADDQTRHQLVNQVKKEVIQALNKIRPEQNPNDLLQQAIMVSESYFSREYSV
jgi:hypothetical protein